MILELNKKYELKADDLEKALVELGERFDRENTTAEVEFWENLKEVKDWEEEDD